jgi:hypothetical protein
VVSLRFTYEQQLKSLKQEANDRTNGVSSLSNQELLLAINYYLHYFDCNTWTIDELLNIELKLNYETGTVRT